MDAMPRVAVIGGDMITASPFGKVEKADDKSEVGMGDSGR